MKDSLILQDKNYISARRVHELFGYTSDYVGQLCRAGKLDSKMIGRAWFVTEQSVRDHLANVTEVVKSKVSEKKKASKKLYHQKLSEAKLIISTTPEFKIETKVESKIESEIEPKIFVEEKKEVQIGVPVYANIQSIPVAPIVETKLEERIAEIEQIITPQVEISEVPNHPIVLVPKTFSLPFYISESFAFPPFEAPRKKSAIILTNLTNLSLTVGVCVIAFVFFFQNILPTNFSTTNIVKNISDVSEVSTASVVSATQEVGKKISSFFSGISELAFSTLDNMFERKEGVVVMNDLPDTVNATESIPFNGIAVVPATESSEQDEIVKQKIRESFSDDVVVKPDETGTAGIITPVFRKAQGDDFLYVLVPVTQNQQ